MEQLNFIKETILKKATILAVIICALVIGGGFACKKKEKPIENNQETEKEAIKKKPEKLKEAFVKPDDKYYAVVKTNKGTFKFKFYTADAPYTSSSFINLARAGFYDGLTFHRVIKGFMIQGGDPDGTGKGGPGFSIDAEFNKNKHLKGTVAMARSQSVNSAGSQWYVCLEPQPFLDGEYTVFGQVVEGQDVVDAIGNVPTTGSRRRPQDRPLEPVIMEKITIEKE